ncbi:MAG: hypothetical protein Q9165_000309 [Trypethelium subeluteriae]
MAASRSGSAVSGRVLGKDDTATADFNAILAAGGNAFEEAARWNKRQAKTPMSASPGASSSNNLEAVAARRAADDDPNTQTSSNEGGSGSPKVSMSDQSNDPLLKTLRSSMESLSLYGASGEPKHQSQASAGQPMSAKSYCVDAGSVQEELPVTKLDLKKNQDGLRSVSAPIHRREPSSDPKFATDTSVLPASPQPSASVDETGASKSLERIGSTDSKRSPFGGDLMTSKYASKSYSPEPTSRYQSPMGLFEDRSRVPPMSLASKKPRILETIPSRDSTRERSSTYSHRAPPLESSRYPQPASKPHRLADTSEQTGNQTMEKSKAGTNKAFGHSLLKQDAIQSRLTVQWPTRKALTASSTKSPVSQQDPTVPSRAYQLPGSSGLGNTDSMLADLVPLPGAHDGKFDRLSSAERSQSAANQRKMEYSVEASLRAHSAWVHQTVSDPFVGRTEVHDPDKAKEIRDKAIQDAQTEAQQATPIPFTTQLAHSSGMEEKKVVASGSGRPLANMQVADVFTTNAEKQRRIIHGTVLTNALNEKWTEHKKQKQEGLRREQLGKMSELDATLSTEGDQKVDMFVKEQTKSLNNKKTALNDELAQKLGAFRKDQKAAHDMQLEAWEKERSQIREALANHHRAEQDDIAKSLDERYLRMKDRLEAGIKAYVDQLGSEDGMSKIVQRLFPGVEHGDPDDDIKILKPGLSSAPSQSVPSSSEVCPPSNISSIPEPSMTQNDPVISGAISRRDGEAQTKNDFGSPASTERKKRERGTSERHKIKMMNLPPECSASVVVSLVWGGDLKSIDYSSGSKSAFVQFVRSQDCSNYLQATGGRIKFQSDKNALSYWIHLEGCLDTDNSNQEAEDFGRDGMTRCVRVDGVDQDWTIQALTRVASGFSRKIERVYDSVDDSGTRAAHIHFCSVRDAVNFMDERVRDPDFENSNVLFTADPCAQATGVHHGSHSI